MKGKVIRFNKKKGFGFIKSAEDQDVFFHYSSLVMEGFKDIAVDSEVEFDVEQTEKGLRASNVRKIDWVGEDFNYGSRLLTAFSLLIYSANILYYSG